MFIEDLADSLPSYYRRGLLRLPEAIPKPVHHLVHMEAQKRVELVKALISWHLVDELMRCEGVDDGEFKVDYSVNFKPTQALTKWVVRLGDWPAILQSAYLSRESTQEKADLPALTGADVSTEQTELWKDLQAAFSWNRRGHLSYWHKLLQLVEGVAWQLCWMRRTRGDPQAYSDKLQAFALQHGYSEVWQQVQGSISAVMPCNKDTITTLLHCVMISPLILFKWARDAAPPLVQCLMYACGVDNRDKPAKLCDVERGMWLMLLGVAAGTFTAEKALVSFLQLCYTDLRDSSPVLQGSPWFDVPARLKHPRGSQTSSIEVAPETGVALQQIDTPVDKGPINFQRPDVLLEDIPYEDRPSTIMREGWGSSVSIDDLADLLLPLQWRRPTSKALGADASVPDSNVEERLRPKRPQEAQDGLSEDAGDEKDLKVPPTKKAKQKKKLKKKSKVVVSSEEEELDVQQPMASGSEAVPLIQQRPPRLRMSKQELAQYTQKGVNDEDNIWRSTFLQVHQTKGPVMGHPACQPSPPVHSQLTERDDKSIWIDAFSVAENRWVRFQIDCLKASNPFERDILESLLACRTDRLGENPPWLDRTNGHSSIAHLRYSKMVKVLPLFRERSVLVMNVPQGPKKWGWNSWTARELGDLHTPIIVHELVRQVTEGSAHSVKPTVEVTSTLQTVLNEGSKGATGRVLNALTLLMLDTMLQTPLFHQVASHLEACKVTRAIGSDLLSAPFPAAALSWGLATVAGAVTPPHSDFGGSAVKIHTLAGCKIWFVINKRKESEDVDSWDIFVHDFHGDSQVNKNVYECEVVLVEPGTIWFQRPNTLYTVVTETNSLVFGQHFFPASAIRSVVMGWIHMAFLSFAITNVEHWDMRVLLLWMMAYWKKVITEEEDLAAHEGHVPDISTHDGFLDLCALGNLLIYLPAFSGQKDRHWNDLRFAVAQYWEMASWANQHLALTGLHESGKVYEAHVAFKLSALQFRQALIDYHEAIKQSHLYKVIDNEDRLHRTWFRMDVVKLCKDVIGDELKCEQRRAERPQEDSLFWEPPFDVSRVEDIPDHVDILRYDDIDFGDDAAQGDKLDSSPLTSVSGTSEPKDGSSAGPLMQLASPTRPGNPKNQNVSDSESSESPLSAPRDQATPRKGKHSKVLEMTTDQLGSPKKHVSKKWRLSARATLAADTSDDSSDTHPNIVHHLKTKHRLSMDSDGSMDPQASSNDSDSAFLDTLEGASQATYAYSELEDNEESSPHDSNPVDWSASLVLRSQSPMAEELSDLSNGERFDVLMARHEEAMRRREGIPVSAVEFGDGELGEEYLRFMSEDVFSHGLTDEKGAPASVDVPPTSKRPLDKSVEERETTVKCQWVLSPSPASDIGALITATSQSFVGLSRVGLPSDLVQQIIAIDSGLRDHQATDSDKDEENPIYEINDKDKDDEPESPAEVSQWRDEFKKGLYNYLKDHQPVISLLDGEESPTLQCDLYQCVCSLLNANPDSMWCFYGRSIWLNMGSLQRLLKMGSS
ncbi:uncharacterized protein ARMOST_09868 [Armillaria ostoyae]|uniref:JmjC domain-containing protein n=1 Tax=Armillaria ostoyae TaxID=47428 RepID=A0A284RCQ6_ARMOS|nr:uncharacterized protein ARMOST_09868 [Armillaria ostoyae]